VLIDTNAPGYYVNISSVKSTLDHNPVISPTNPTIASTTGTLAVPATLANGTWGFAIPDGQANYDGITPAFRNFSQDNDYESNQSSVIFAAIPVAPTPPQTDDSAETPPPVTSYTFAKADTMPMATIDYQIYYGAKVNATQPAGTYQNTVTYTAIGEEAPAPTNFPSDAVASYNITTMQALTGAICDSAIYDDTDNGANANNTAVLTDTRDARQYTVRKLADGHCWMIDNLKLSPDTALTSADTDLNTISTFDFGGHTSLIAGTSPYDYDTPYVYGPVPGDTGSDETNYGYLYNWSAATAGESMTSMPGDGTNGDVAPNSICPRNWRLPQGGDYGAFDPNNEFDQLNAKMAGYPDNQDPTYQSFQSSNYNDPQFYDNWQFDGAFRGVFAGLWYIGFVDQGGDGVLWSSSANPGNPNNAFNANFDSSNVNPDNNTNRNNGLTLR
jgi:uncharacterized protein (TIGR02145 family)